MFNSIPDAPVAEAAHAAAVQLHSALSAKAGQAAASVRSLRADRAVMIDRAARGEDVDAAALRALDARMADAERAHEIAYAIAAGAATKRHEAEIVALAAKARDCRVALAAAVARRVVAAERLDAALAAARAAFRQIDEVGSEVQRALLAGHMHDRVVLEAATRNPVLAAMEPSVLPRARFPERASVARYRAELPVKAAAADWNARTLEAEAMAAAAERGDWNAFLPTPAAA